MDIGNNFKAYKSVISELLIAYYGNSYKEIIEKRINSTCFDFNSCLEDEYNFFSLQRNLISTEDFLQNYFDPYFEDKRINRQIKDGYNKILFKWIKENFNIENIDMINKENKDNFLSLFYSNNFDVSLIDAFSSKTKKMKDDSNSNSLINAIDNDKETFFARIKNMGIKIIGINPSIVDSFIEFREKIKFSYKLFFTKESNEGKRIIKEIEKQLGVKVPMISIVDFVFPNNPNFSTLFNDGIRYLKVPIISNLLINNNALDASFLHELIHCVEFNDNLECGLDCKGKYRFFNEIITDLKANKLTTYLHDNGIFIFDAKNYYSNKIKSLYSCFFPVIEEFYFKYEALFNYCSINTKVEFLERCFSKTAWNNFIRQLEKDYNRYITNYFSLDKSQRTIDNITLDLDVSKYNELIKKMDDYFYKNISNKYK